MFELFSTNDWRGLLVREAPGLLVSIVLTEFLYKFHSFTLECAGFLATWYVLGRIQQACLGRRA